MRTSRKKGGGSREMRSASELLYINLPLKKGKTQDFLLDMPLSLTTMPQ